jgi:nucleoside 2-deoxyribosyltransferase
MAENDAHRLAADRSEIAQERFVCWRDADGQTFSMHNHAYR